MKQSFKFAATVVASLGLGVAVATAYAHPGQMGDGTGPHAKGGMQHGAQGGSQHGMKGGRGPGAMGHGPAGQGAGHALVTPLVTPEERTALQEKMRNAATPEERQKIAQTFRAEVQKRAQEKGITLPEHRGPHFGTPRASVTK